MKNVPLMNPVRTLLEKLKKNLVERDLVSEADDYWKMSDFSDRIRDQSHWCGEGRWTEKRWFTYGDFYGGMIDTYLKTHYGPSYAEHTKNMVALDWGCGGGAISRVLTDRFGLVYGIEISPATLQACERRMKILGKRNFVGIVIAAYAPEEVIEKCGKESVDFILSIAVFKHFPSKEYTKRILKVFSSLLKPNALALIQYRYDNGSPKYKQKNNNYAKNVITMTSFTPEEFQTATAEAGLHIIATQRDGDNQEENHQYAFIRRAS
ncbi:MAG: class I SAM-dependent methyltransferase [Syntrophales bacterium]|nr:class I SAM-dependent methyltransferase [Syntrophales bacterium]